MKFFSLGSRCQIANQLIAAGIRQESPCDWIKTDKHTVIRKLAEHRFQGMMVGGTQIGEDLVCPTYGFSIVASNGPAEKLAASLQYTVDRSFNPIMDSGEPVTLVRHSIRGADITDLVNVIRTAYPKANFRLAAVFDDEAVPADAPWGNPYVVIETAPVASEKDQDAEQYAAAWGSMFARLARYEWWLDEAIHP